LSGKEQEGQTMVAIETSCNKASISIEALQNGSRRWKVSRVRSSLSIRLIQEYDLSLAETVRQVGIPTSTAAKNISRKKTKSN